LVLVEQHDQENGDGDRYQARQTEQCAAMPIPGGMNRLSSGNEQRLNIARTSPSQTISVSSIH
jgi:hypothetical protein